MKKIVIVTSLICMMFVLAACGDNVTDNSGDKSGVSVVTTLFAPYDFAKNIVGENGSVTMLLAPGEEAHSFDPTPQDIIAIGECDLFIYNGGENESWVQDVLASLDSDVKTICMMDTVETVFFEEHVEGMQSSHEDGGHESDDTMNNENIVNEHAEEEYDEHVWASLDNAIVISNEIAGKLADIDENNASVYKKNAEMYTAEISELRDEITMAVRNSSANTLIYGDRFPMRYFTEEYSLDYYAAFPGCSADTEASAATIKFLIDKVNELGVKVIIKSEMSSGNIAETIAAETGAKVMTMYACHNISKEDYDAGVGYVELMERNLSVLKEALN